MATDQRDTALRFRTLIEQQIEDLDLLDAGETPAYFFDTSDVHNAALGMLAFYPRLNWDSQKREWNLDGFKRRRTTVRMLLASGWLGEFSLLPPHQREFLTLLEM